MAGIVIAGTNSGAGKTTIAMGLMAALNPAMRVQPFKVGPDYIDPAFHSYITGRPCRNLDSWMLADRYLKYLYHKNSADADISVIEGVMGLYDGAEIGSDIGSTAQVAKILRLPVVLVVDGKGISQSVAAVVKGYADFDRQVNLKGVIFNNLSSENHYRLLKEAVEMYSSIKTYGYLPKMIDVSLPERHLGLVPAIEQGELKFVIDKIAQVIRKTVDIEGLVKLSHSARKCSAPKIEINKITNIRLALAFDKAFNFYYQDNLDLLQIMGAEIIRFSPLADQRLPQNIDALVLGGGFPEVFAAELASNRPMLTDIKHNLERGLPYIAECGGLMYLCNSITDLNAEKHQMVGWFKGDSLMTKRLQRFGYAELKTLQPSIYGEPDKTIRVHEFHRSKIEMKDERSIFELRKIRNKQLVKQWQCGFAKNRGVGSYAHLHYYANLSFPQSFIKFVENPK